MWPNPQEIVDFVIFTKEILNGRICAFPQNFHTRKLGEITGFVAVLMYSKISYVKFRKKNSVNVLAFQGIFFT